MAQDSVLVTVPLSRLSLVVETVGGVAHLLPEKGTEAPQRCLCSPARTHTHTLTLCLLSPNSRTLLYTLSLSLFPLSLSPTLSHSLTLSLSCVCMRICAHTHTHSLTHSHTHTHTHTYWADGGHLDILLQIIIASTLALGRACWSRAAPI